MLLPQMTQLMNYTITHKLSHRLVVAIFGICNKQIEKLLLFLHCNKKRKTRKKNLWSQSKCRQRSVIHWGAIWMIFFHPAKFDNFKDLERSWFSVGGFGMVQRTNSFPPFRQYNRLTCTKQKLSRLKTNYEQLLRGIFFFFKHFSIRTIRLHKMKLKKKI